VTAGGRAHPALANFTLASAFILFVWALLGPLQSNWNASANNGAGSGQRSSSDTVPASAQIVTPTTAAVLPSSEEASVKDAGESDAQ
jgi:hypothetical protein